MSFFQQIPACLKPKFRTNLRVLVAEEEKSQLDNHKSEAQPLDLIRSRSANIEYKICKLSFFYVLAIQIVEISIHILSFLWSVIWSIQECVKWPWRYQNNVTDLVGANLVMISSR